MPGRWNPTAVWLQACFVTLLVLDIFYYWYVQADRYVVFLYNHNQATPFDDATTSRYWMSGLIAAGIVLVCTAVGNWFAGRVFGLKYRVYRAPAGWQIWWRCAPWISAGILIITTALGQPRLPPTTAVLCVGATLVGLAMALPLSSLAAAQPAELAWRLLYGAGLAPALILFRFLGVPDTAYGVSTAGLASGSIIVSGGWLMVLTMIRVRRYLPAMSFCQLLAAGLVWSYLLMPLAHYWLLTPPRYRYVSVAANFFAATPDWQLLSLGLAITLTLGVTSFQRRLSERRRTPELFTA